MNNQEFNREALELELEELEQVNGGFGPLTAIAVLAAGTLVAQGIKKIFE